MPDPQIYNDKELILRIAEGDEQAFTQFFRTWATPLAAIAMKIVRNEYARQEVVQEVFIKIWLHRDKLANVGNMGAWLRKITVNQSLLALQRHAAQDKRLSEIVTIPNTEEGNLLEIKETRRLISEAIDALPPQRKTIYEMNRIQGKTSREIAEQLQLSHGYVRNALSAALVSIRERLMTDLGLQLFLLLVLF